MDSAILAVLISSAISALTTYLVTSRQKEKDLQERLQILCYGVQALLRNKMLELHEVYRVAGWCTVDQKVNFENIYSCYHTLGTNGVMTKIKDEVLAMPTEAPNMTIKGVLDNNDNETLTTA